jgi:hypothetical protein
MLGSAMLTQRYAVNQVPIATLFSWLQSQEIAIPEIQRPFVWDASKVRNLLDSLLKGYPVGYLIAWRNPTVKLKDGSRSEGKRILIDGQQRVTALMAALLGREVVNKDYLATRIRIAYNPTTSSFEVHNPAIAKNKAWIPDVSRLFDPATGVLEVVRAYCADNPEVRDDDVYRSLERLKGITGNQIGLIELADMDIETVTEIFIRVNSAGVTLSQADFAMSKIAVNETHGGNALRKAIDYFCHMAVAPEFHSTVERNDPAFTTTEFFPAMSWLRKENDDLYDPTYTDILRVAFTSEFRRGKMEDLVALLSGRNFETKQYEAEIIEDSFKRLKESVLRFMNETHFKRFVMLVRSAGFLDASMIGSQNALNFAYVLYLTLRSMKVPDNDIERHVRRWFVMSVLTGRYSGGSPESTFDYDIRQIHQNGFDAYSETSIRAELSDAFWAAALPQKLDTSATSSPLFHVFQAAQIVAGDKGFLSRDITVRSLIETKGDVHHIFPKDYLKKSGVQRAQYNQIGNYAVAQSEINIAIRNKSPQVYLGEVMEQCRGGQRRYGNITDAEQLHANLAAHCIPPGTETMTLEDYPRFLAERRVLMATRIRKYFEAL